MKDYSDKKILIFSDTHLTCKFDETFFSEMKKLVKKYDLIIINGDFWESIACDFQKFTNSEWQKTLFPLLKEKTIFIYGNHDPKRLTDENVNLFSFQQDNQLKFKSGKYIFEVEHGDRIIPDFDFKHRVITIFIEKFFPSFWIWLSGLDDRDNFLGRLFKKYMDRQRRKETKLCRKISQENYQENVIKIYGHIHTPKHNLEDNFIILGAFKNGRKRFIEIQNGEIIFFNSDEG